MVWAVWQTVLRYYHLWCAREDVVRAGLRTPAGVWVCDHCGTVVLSPRLVPAHLTTAHWGSSRYG